MSIKKTVRPAEKLLDFEIFHNGKLFRTVKFSSFRKCNNWREKNLETPFLYVIRTPSCNRENCIEISKRYFETKHRVYPDLFERPEWDVITDAEVQLRAEQRIILEARERTGMNISVQVGGGKYDVTVVHYDKPMHDRVEIINGDLSREEAYKFIHDYCLDPSTEILASTEEVTPLTKMTQAERQQLILSVLLDVIKPQNTGWREISKALEDQNVIEPDGWLEVRQVLQYLLDQGRIARPEFDPHADDEYYFANTIDHLASTEGYE